MGGGASKQKYVKQDEIDSKISEMKNDVGGVEISGRYHTQRKLTDDYDVQEDKTLGEGYNGKVLLAYRKRESAATGVGKQKYAVKPFKLQGLSKASVSELRNEVEVFLCMDHPHIARLKDVYQEKDRLNLVMECLEGGEMFERIKEKKKFSEKEAANNTMQMLRAVSYLHHKNIVHRDIKLENFLYDAKGSDHLKLIDFGFSKVFRKKGEDIKLVASCGTISYMAPEVLATSQAPDNSNKGYDEKVDLWSVGVVVFILLLGYMPFGSSVDSKNIEKIRSGAYTKKPAAWKKLSKNAQGFIEALLVVDPKKRLTAAEALEHPFITQREQGDEKVLDDDIVKSLQGFANDSMFRRTCLSMMAWSLTNAERSSVRKAFVEMDVDKTGVLSLANMKEVLHKHAKAKDIKDEEIERIFSSLDVNHNEEVNYTDFLAAMLKNRINAHDDLILEAFDRFDKDKSGFITAKNLTELLSVRLEGTSADAMIAEADFNKDGRISKEEFIRYIKGGLSAQENMEGIEHVIEHELEMQKMTSEQYRHHRPADTHECGAGPTGNGDLAATNKTLNSTGTAISLQRQGFEPEPAKSSQNKEPLIGTDEKPASKTQSGSGCCSIS